MYSLLSIICLLLVVICTSWIVSKVFSFIYVIVTSPLVGIVWGVQKYVSEKYQKRVWIGLSILIVPIGYYFACIWPAYIISWIIVPNLQVGTWWLYGIALGGFCMSEFASLITFTAFIIFCFKPELVKTIYGWVPYLI